MAKTRLFAWMGQMVRRAMVEDAANQAEKRIDTPVGRAISRREFLKTMLGAAGAMATINLAAPAHTPKHIKKPVIIIGGGLAGLVTAYRLMQHRIPCEIYEASGRVGGRVHTLYRFNREDMFVELGGELVDTGHEELIGLCGELKVPLERFAEDEPGIEPAIYFSEGKVHTEKDVLEAFAPLAKALAKDINRSFPDGEIHIPTYREPYNARWLDRTTLAEYLDRQSDTPSWLIRLIKTAYTGEYGLDPEEQSALNLLLLIGVDSKEGFRMFGESDEAMRIQGGNSRIVNAVYDAIREQVPVHFNHTLSKIHARSQGDIHLEFDSTNGDVHVKASHAVSAIPFTILREVDGVRSLPLSEVKRKTIAAWGYGTNSKQMIGFRSRFWRKANGDMPANSGEMFLDRATQCYWETSRLQSGESGILTNFLGGRAGKSAESHQWKTALKDLNELYSERARQEFDDNKAFSNWFENKLTRGSYSCPKPGQYTTLSGSAGEPELDGRLLFAGEHCSLEWAGFMNGAVQSGENAAAHLTGERAAAAVWTPVRTATA